MCRQFIIVASLLVLLAGASRAQTNITSSLSKIIPGSPEASAITLYQNYEVDPMTGVPAIDIPLFNLDTKMGKIPFSLSYHIGRLKPSELTGPMGWGWTLTPNLGITRSIIGNKDEIGAGYIGSNPQFGSSDCLYNLSVARGYFDEQPDDFYYSLLSGGGRFLYKRDGTFSTSEEVKVTRNTNESFQIIDVDGTIYKFGKYSSGTSVATEKSGVAWPFQANPNDLITWKVTEIISYDKTDTIKFTYGTPTTWDVQHYNSQVKIIEYPGNSNYQPQVYRTLYNGSQCSNGNAPTWEAVRMTAGGSGWPVNSTNMYDVFDVNVSEFNQGLPFWAEPVSFCSPIVPTTCEWNTSFDYSTELVCFGDIQKNNLHCWSFVDRKDNRNYVCPTGATYASDGLDMPTEEVLQNNRIEELSLTGITYRGGMVSISYDSAHCKEITLYAKTNAGYILTKRIKVGQHPVTDITSFAIYRTDCRYLLDSLTIAGSDDIVNERYKFEYLTDNISPLAVNFGCDMFGFADHGRTNNMPKVAYKINNYKWREIDQQGAGTVWGANREGTIVGIFGSKMLVPANETSSYWDRSVRVAALKKITYPTGGTANFEFERNRFLGPDLQKQYFGGGYRIKSIKYTDGFGKDSLTRSYAYGTNESGAGVVKYLPTIADYVFQQTTDFVDPTIGMTVRKQITTINATPFYNLLFDNGAAVLYPQVTEYIGRPDANAGKTIYDYFIGGLNNYHIPNSPVQENRRNEWMFKSLQSKRYYVAVNNSYTLVKKSQMSYTDFVTDTLRCGAAYQKFFDEDDIVVCSNQGVYSHRYDIYPGVKKLKQVNDTLYAQDGIGYFATATNYVYDPATLFARTISTQTSKGEQRDNKIWYSNDASLLTGWNASQVSLLNSMKAANRISVPVKEEQILAGVLKKTAATYFMQSASNNQIYPSEILSATYTNPLQTDVRFVSYDINGNILEQRKEYDAKEVYFWGYGGKHAVAKLLNTDYNVAKQYVNQSILDNPSSDQQLRTELQKLRDQLPGAMVNTYTYKPEVGITSETDPMGKTVFYEYDTYGRLKVIKDNDGKILKVLDYQYSKPVTQ